MSEKAEVPDVPKIRRDRKISEKSGNNLLAWKKAFQDLGCTFNLEEDSQGSVSFEEGSVAQIFFSIFPSDVQTYGFGVGEAMLYIGDKATVLLEQHSDSTDDTFKLIEELGSPITRKNSEGTWHDIYNKIADYCDFKKKLIPLVPEL